MVLPEFTHYQTPPKRTVLCKTFSLVADGFLFVGGASLAISLIWALLSTINPNSFEETITTTTQPSSNDVVHCSNSFSGVDPPELTFYDDPNLSYSIDRSIRNWDQKRKQWLKHHPNFAGSTDTRVLIVTGSQPGVCRHPSGDHLQLRLFKNKVDYARIHGHEIFYNNALLHPKMTGFWAKYPLVKSAMLAHPEAEWVWWVDSDAVFTDMEFKLPLEKYDNYNLVVHGWSHAVYDEKSWTGLNAGVFLIRNCQWSMELVEAWTRMGPQSPDYQKWGKTQKSLLKDKLYPESDDQAALIYLLLKENERWGKKIYLESEYNLEGYWLALVDKLNNITGRYMEIEQKVGDLRRRHAEKVSEYYGMVREEYLKDVVRRPFVIHFTGCEPCTGDHNPTYTWEACWNGMQKALNFADNQVLRRFGFVHPDLLDSSLVSPLPFDFPLV
ncbi:Glycosyltransferase [Parasponia andersonii]|uniref:Glycosyltransferase n=1 Tax=Parasponia andersonii TaxID=3476 RepID=A0A2P5DV72_PARAD|nr:Glycosyltransferase [Parasponia andersonii]